MNRKPPPSFSPAWRKHASRRVNTSSRLSIVLFLFRPVVFEGNLSTVVVPLLARVAPGCAQESGYKGGDATRWTILTFPRSPPQETSRIITRARTKMLLWMIIPWHSFHFTLVVLMKNNPLPHCAVLPPLRINTWLLHWIEEELWCDSTLENKISSCRDNMESGSSVRFVNLFSLLFVEISWEPSFRIMFNEGRDYWWIFDCHWKENTHRVCSTPRRTFDKN